MTKASTVVITLVFLSALALAQEAPKAEQRLHEAYPKVEWKSDSAARVDIDCDGKPDTFVLGIDPQVPHTYKIQGKAEKYLYPEVVMGFALGSGKKPQTVNIPFLKNTGYYGFRTFPKKIEVQPLSCDWEGRPLPGCVENDRCQSMWVRDGEDGEVFVFWDSERKAVGWVRH